MLYTHHPTMKETSAVAGDLAQNKRWMNLEAVAKETKKPLLIPSLWKVATLMVK